MVYRERKTFGWKVKFNKYLTRKILLASKWHNINELCKLEPFSLKMLENLIGMFNKQYFGVVTFDQLWWQEKWYSF